MAWVGCVLDCRPGCGAKPDPPPPRTMAGVGGDRPGDAVGLVALSLATQDHSSVFGCRALGLGAASLRGVPSSLEIPALALGLGGLGGGLARPQNGQPPGRSGIRGHRHDGGLGRQQQHDGRGCRHAQARPGFPHRGAPDGPNCGRPDWVGCLRRRVVRPMSTDHRRGRRQALPGICESWHGGDPGHRRRLGHPNLLDRIRRAFRGGTHCGGADRRRKPRRRRGFSCRRSGSGRGQRPFLGIGHVGRCAHPGLRRQRQPFRISDRPPRQRRGVEAGRGDFDRSCPSRPRHIHPGGNRICGPQSLDSIQKRPDHRPCRRGQLCGFRTPTHALPDPCRFLVAA